MKAFVTGATGFVGANLVRRLLSNNADVHIITRPSSKMWRLQSVLPNIHNHEGDINDAAGMEKITVAIKPDVIFHLGVYGAYPQQNDPQQILQTTIFGSLNLFAAARRAGVSVIVNTGSSSEYGKKNHPMNEAERIAPNTYYGIGKAAQTMLAEYFAREEHTPTITLRLFSVYGPYEEPGRLVPTVIQKALRHQDIELVGPTVARDFIYVDDVVQAFIAASKRPDLAGETFNVGNGQQKTLNDIFEAVVVATNSTAKPVWGAYEKRSFDTNIWVADMKKTEDVLRTKPQVELAEGIKKTVAWFKAHQHFYG